MTFNDVLDHVAYDAGDTSSEYQDAALRWLNAARSYIANRSGWSGGLDPDFTFTTSSGTTSGLYALTGVEHVAGDRMFDQTNQNNLEHDALGNLMAVDQEKETTGPPKYWANAGLDASGDRQVYLWPVPDDTYTIMVPVINRFTDITDSDLTDTVDSYFGPIAPWASVLFAGIRYYHDLNNNEDPNQIALQKLSFDREIARKAARNSLSVPARVPATVVKTSRGQLPTGRFDPAHYNNG